MGRRGPAGPQVNLLRVVELLQTHITPALCHAVFGRVRRTERQRVWTLDALVRFWTAVILRAPTALSQALADARDAREPLFPRIEATPEAFFQRCRDLRPAFFAEVFRRFTARLVDAVPPRYAAEVAPICERFADVVILDGSAWRRLRIGSSCCGTTERWSCPAVCLVSTICAGVCVGTSSSMPTRRPAS